MGTGALACATFIQSDICPFLVIPAGYLHWFNIVLFACLMPYAFLTWLGRGKEVYELNRLPAKMAFFSTTGIALLVLANQCLVFGLGVIPAAVFWVAGSGITIALNFTIVFKVFLERQELQGLSPVFFIPVVGLVVIPVAGSSLSAQFAGPWNAVWRLVCVFGLGAGLLLYSALFALMFQKHLLLEPEPDYLTPTLWIHLAPLSWGAISMLSLGRLAGGAEAGATLEFFALLAWGAAAWWVIMALLLTIRALIRKGLTFSMAWWSFIFPLGSFTILTRLLAFTFSGEISFAVWILMTVIWLYAAMRTIGLFAGAIRTWRHGK
ncbi:MAG: hypothetical protein NC112_07555 [Oxalobacter formigenes]|nr:hypothetical protein [Oxalobacter formigenes]